MRPPFIVSAADVAETVHRYRDSDEGMAPSRAVGRAAGLLRIGIHLVRVPPGTRTSYPHAESAEEEFVYVIEGEIDAWIDGEVHRMKAGDFAAFPSGTGICHTFINDGERDALLLSGGEADKAEGRIFYPLNPERRAQMPWSRWWEDVPHRPRGPHDGRPRRR
ncbi:MAG TPA: cupin domain-containing protein [Anaeromyxobacteraceae bacterium]|nr:cupin domain-containing protein [Anaeromyxobacteraceae bacterium]